MSTILIVDDSLMDREILGTYLKQSGLTVLNAENATEAMDKIHRNQTSLVVLDIIMDGKSGFEVCRQLKANAETKSIPVLLCSSKSTAADKLWGEAVGADGYIAKPVDQQEFMNKVWQLLR